MTSCGSYCQHSFRLKFGRIRHAPAMPQNNLEGRDSIRSFHFGILFAISNNTKTIPPNQKNQWSATASVKSKISCRTGYPPRQAGALGSVSWKRSWFLCAARYLAETLSDSRRTRSCYATATWRARPWLAQEWESCGRVHSTGLSCILFAVGR